jgi:hypothetical protein
MSVFTNIILLELLYQLLKICFLLIYVHLLNVWYLKHISTFPLKKLRIGVFIFNKHQLYLLIVLRKLVCRYFHNSDNYSGHNFCIIHCSLLAKNYIFMFLQILQLRFYRLLEFKNTSEIMNSFGHLARLLKRVTSMTQGLKLHVTIPYR